MFLSSTFSSKNYNPFPNWNYWPFAENLPYADKLARRKLTSIFALGFRGGGDSLSGAYLFLPDGQAKPMPTDENRFILIDGPLVKKLFVQSNMLIHHVKLDVADRYLTISNAVDVNKGNNLELAMRMKTAVQSGDISFTDLNGLQVFFGCSNRVFIGIFYYRSELEAVLVEQLRLEQWKNIYNVS